MTRTSEAVQQLEIWLQWCCWPLPDVNGWSSRLVPLKKLDDAHENDTKMTRKWLQFGSSKGFWIWMMSEKNDNLKFKASAVPFRTGFAAKGDWHLNFCLKNSSTTWEHSNLPCRANRNGKHYGKPMASHMEWLMKFQIHPVFHGTVAACVVDVENVHLVLLWLIADRCSGPPPGKKTLDLGIWMKFFFKSTNFQILQWKNWTSSTEFRALGVP